MAPVDRLRKQKKKEISVALLKVAPKPPMPDMEEMDDAEETQDDAVPMMPRDTPAQHTNDSLCKNLQQLVNEVFTFYMTAQKYHWNVVAENFSELHKFFGKIYVDANESVDGLAEKMRQLGDMVDVQPGKTGSAMDAEEMLADLYKMNEDIIGSLKDACKMCDHAYEPGISNFLAGRVEQHQKNSWMLKSFVDA